MSGVEGIDPRTFLKGTGGVLMAADMDARSYASGTATAASHASAVVMERPKTTAGKARRSSSSQREGGRKEFDPWESGPVYKQTPLPRGPAADGGGTLGPDDDDVVHLITWLQSMRSRKQRNATVNHGFSHSIVCIMAPVLLGVGSGSTGMLRAKKLSTPYEAAPAQQLRING